MTLSGRMRGRTARRAWPIASAPTRQLTYLILVDIVAVVWAAAEFTHFAASGLAWFQLIMLVVLAVVFEEASARAARLRLRVGAELKQDLTSVWALAAAIALPAPLAVLGLVTILTYTWLRQQRPSGESLYGTVFNTADFVLSCLCAAVVFHLTDAAAEHLPWELDHSLPIAVALVAYALVNRLIVTGALVAAGIRGRALIGTRSDNLIEFATLCLGGLVALAVTLGPWLAVLAIAPLAALQRGALVAEFETAATVDIKTGLLNAVAWDHVAQREIARAVRMDTPLAVLIIDIDRFKLVNDEFGHLVGDNVLREIGRCLDAGVREYDSVGRFGGEEFVAVLPDADDAAATVIAERLRARVNRLRIRDLVDGVDASNTSVLSVSIGVAGLHAPDVELNELLRDADAALYRAKDAGRNRVVLAGDGTGESDARLRMA